MDEKDLQNARQAYSMLCASLDDIGYHYQQNDEDLDVHFEVTFSSTATSIWGLKRAA